MYGSNTVSITIKSQILFQSLIRLKVIRLKYDEVHVQVLHNGVSKYLLLNIIFFSLLDSDWLKSVPINP